MACWKAFLSAYGMPGIQSFSPSSIQQPDNLQPSIDDSAIGETAIEKTSTSQIEKKHEPPYFCQKELSQLYTALLKFQKSEVYAMEHDIPDSELVLSIDRSVENARLALDSCEKSDREAYRAECARLFANMNNFLLFTIESDRKYFMPFLNLLTSISFVCIAAVFIGIAYIKKKEEADILAEKNKEEQLLTKAIAQVQESERRRISRDLHDTVMQDTRTSLLFIRELESLHSIDNNSSPKNKIENPETKKSQLIEKIKMLEEQNMKNIRSIIRNLTPPEIENANFGTLLQDFAQTAEYAYNIPCKFYAEPGTPFPALSAEQKLHIFRIIQESVTNAAKHSGASEISVIARREDAHIVFLVSDDGHGFNTNEAEASKAPAPLFAAKKTEESGQIPTGTHLGLRGMKSRADILRAQLTVKSNPDSGTQVRLSVGVM